jgi:hypothetical protein
MDILASYSTPLAPRLRSAWREGVQQLIILPRRSWKVIAVAIAFVALKEGREVFNVFGKTDWFDRLMMLVLVALGLFWLVAAVGEFFGTEIVSVEGGELVISRGIGLLRRTFRYPVGQIAELVSTDGSVDEHGKRHLHHIFLKPKTGAVRFEFGQRTVHFADSLDEAQGEQIVRWLKPKLPISAMAPLPLDHGGAANFRP